MPEVISGNVLNVDYESPIAEAARKAGFTIARIPQVLLDETRFAPTQKGILPINSHYVDVQSELGLEDIPHVMSERMYREPADLREVLALGSKITVQDKEWIVHAPKLTCNPNLVLKIKKYPEWMGIFLSTWDPEHDRMEDVQFVGFSDD